MQYAVRKTLYAIFALALCLILFTFSTLAAETGKVNTPAGVNLRSGPSSNSSSLAILPYNATVAIIAADNNWYNVSYNNLLGYVYSKYITVTASASSLNSQNAENAVVNASGGLNMRKNASENSEKICLIPKNAVVAVISDINGWSNIVYNGQIGYCSSSYITYNSSAVLGIGTAAASGGLNMRQLPSTSAKVVCTIPKSARIDIITYSKGGWYYVSYGGNKGYVSSAYVRSGEPVEVSRGGGRSVKTPSASSKGAEAVELAKQYLGVKYKSGGASPSGFDCSGFTQYIYGKMGYKLPHSANSQSQSNLVVNISKSELAAGDLVFFKLPSSSKPIGHVGIYLGNNTFIHASSPGDTVKITSLSSGYYTKNYVCSRRIAW